MPPWKRSTGASQFYLVWLRSPSIPRKLTLGAYEGFGAQGLMVSPSLGYKTDPRETIAWYQGIGQTCALPIMIYNNPIAYGVDVTPAILRSLADTPTIVCVKEESGDIRRITDISIALGERFSIFCWRRRFDRRKCCAGRHGVGVWNDKRMAEGMRGAL